MDIFEKISNTITDDFVYVNDEIDQEDIVYKSSVLIDELNNKSLERDELSRLVALAFLSSKHMFLIGKPGVGKTFLANKLKYVLKDGKTFDYLLAEDTTPEELYGHSFVDDKGNVHHEYDVSVLSANMLILDELFKAKSGLLNGMLGVLSQSRNFYLRGIGEKKLDLICAFVLSNEFPQDSVLDPFDDRLNFRYEVERLKEDESFKRMVKKDYDTTNDFSVFFTYNEIASLRKKFMQVSIPENVLNFYVQLKNIIVQNELNISDRKLDDSMEVFQASAYLNGRSEINYSDLFLIRHMGWRNFTERRKFHSLLHDFFFQKKGELEKDLVSMKERKQMINSYGISNVEPFIFDKIIFDFNTIEEVDRYNNYVDMYINLLEAISTLSKDVEQMKNRYEFTLFIEEEIENNKFLIDFKNNSFTEEFLNDLVSFKREFDEMAEKYYRFVNTKTMKKTYE